MIHLNEGIGWIFLGLLTCQEGCKDHMGDEAESFWQVGNQLRCWTVNTFQLPNLDDCLFQLIFSGLISVFSGLTSYTFTKILNRVKGSISALVLTRTIYIAHILIFYDKAL